MAEDKKKPGIEVSPLIWKENKILLVRRTNHGAGTWSPPGGYLEFGESLEDCACREAYEETGVRVTNIQFRAVTNDVFSEGDKHTVSVWMDCNYLEGEPRINAPGEIDAVDWFDWEDLPQQLYLPLKLLVEGDFYPKPALQPELPKEVRSQKSDG